MEFHPPRAVQVILSCILIVVLQFIFDYLIPRNTPPNTSQFAQRIPLWSVRLTISVAILSVLNPKKVDSYVPYCLAYVVPFITWYAANRGNYWIIIWLVFGAIPLLELVSQEDLINPTKEEERDLQSRKIFKWITIVWVPVQFLFLLWAFWAVSVWQLSTLHFVLFSVSVGFNNGILGINIAHELIHKADPIEKFLGKCLLVSVCYGHWYVEHLYGHHKRVATPLDPATARKGETFYSFWLRSVVFGFISAWNLEQLRLKKQKNLKAEENLPWSSFLKNQIIHLVLGSCLIAAFAYSVFGRQALVLFLSQSVAAFSLLEIVNYIEHYGLCRRMSTTNSKYEPVQVAHSWNANTSLTNYVLFKLQRHSDHHVNAGKRYQVLRSEPLAPQMPTGYAGMIVLALIPPLWFYVMDPRLEQFEKAN